MCYICLHFIDASEYKINILTQSNWMDPVAVECVSTEFNVWILRASVSHSYKCNTINTSVNAEKESAIISNEKEWKNEDKNTQVATPNHTNIRCIHSVRMHERARVRVYTSGFGRTAQLKWMKCNKNIFNHKYAYELHLEFYLYRKKNCTPNR